MSLPVEKNDMKYVIERKEDKELFSDFKDGNVIWDSKDPWIYSRECDALFVLSSMGWIDIADVISLEN